MIKVTYGNNVHRDNDIVESNVTVMSFMETHGMDATAGSLQLNGATMSAADTGKTFAELGFTGEEGKNKLFLIQVQKADNA